MNHFQFLAQSKYLKVHGLSGNESCRLGSSLKRTVQRDEIMRIWNSDQFNELKEYSEVQFLNTSFWHQLKISKLWIFAYKSTEFLNRCIHCRHRCFDKVFWKLFFWEGLSNRCYLGRTVGYSNNVAAFRKWANHRLSSKHQFENRPKPIASELFIAAPPKNKIY